MGYNVTTGNSYGNGVNSTAGENTILHYYDKAGIKAANRVNVFGQWASRKAMPTKMGKTFKISRFEHMYDRSIYDGEFASKGFMSARSVEEIQDSITKASLGEGATDVNKRTLQKVTFETSLARYGEMMDYTDEVDMFSEDFIQTRYREELGELANSRNEDLVMLDMLSTSTRMYSGKATSIATVATDGAGGTIAADGSDDADCIITYDLIRAATKKLVRNRAKKNTSIVTGSTKIGTTPIAKSFYAIIGADVKADLENATRGDVGSNGFTEYTYVPAHKYAGASSLAEGEVGQMHEVRFIEAEGMAVYEGKGGAVPAGYDGRLGYSYSGNGTSITVTNNTGASVDLTVDSVGTLVTIADTAFATITDEQYDYAISNDNTDLTGMDFIITEANFNVHPILFPTEGAFATIGLKGNSKIKFNSKSPAKIDSGNTYGTTGFFSYNMWYAGIFLYEERMLNVLVAASE